MLRARCRSALVRRRSALGRRALHYLRQRRQTAVATSIPKKNRFRLPASVAGARAATPVQFGFPPLGELTYKMHYARDRGDGRLEEWHETVERVVNGTFTLQRHHAIRNNLPWDQAEAKVEATCMYELMYEMQFLPPGRGLWAMGTPAVEDAGLSSALYNCAFVDARRNEQASQGANAHHLMRCFEFVMDQSMLNVGVGFRLPTDAYPFVRPSGTGEELFVVPDTREGWAESLSALIGSYLWPNSRPVRFDYSHIRPKGALLRTFGTVAPGPTPLRRLHDQVRAILEAAADAQLGSGTPPSSARTVLDIMNAIGVMVSSVSKRRSAQIALCDANLEPSFLEWKNYEKYPERANIGWSSNNSHLARFGQNDYTGIAEGILHNGEPGVVWMRNAQLYGRMGDEPNWRDDNAAGTNPCGEATLEHMEMCNLAEVFPMRAGGDQSTFLAAVRAATCYAKSVTLTNTNWPESNRVMQANRRIGVSLSGIVQFLEKYGRTELRVWCSTGYDAVQAEDAALSATWGVPQSRKTTVIKPSGTISLLAGATSGMHWPAAQYYLRRMRLPRDSPFADAIRSAGYHVEPAAEAPDDRLVAAIPVCVEGTTRTRAQVSMREQLDLASLLQELWADQSVSATVTFDPKEVWVGVIETALRDYSYRLKCVSMLPLTASNAYPQMPEEPLEDLDAYKICTADVKPIDYTGISSDASTPEQGCATGACELPVPAEQAACSSSERAKEDHSTKKGPKHSAAK